MPVWEANDTLADLFQWLTTKIGAISGIVTALGVICAAGLKVRTYFSRSRLLVPNAFPLPEIPGEQAIFAPDLPDLSTTLVGRERDIRNLTRTAQDSPLTFLYGESGSGKSTLVKLGVARDLAQSGTWIPIYVDIWGQDWIRGPYSSLASATDFALRALKLATDQPVTGETIVFRLVQLRSKTGRRPLLLFDQIDDYQNVHRDRFRNSDTGVFLGPDELCEANPFWRSLRDLLLSDTDSIHAVFVTREDAKAGLHCFEFMQPRVYPLSRLDSADAKQLIHRVAPETVVKNPQNGFRDLMERVVTELGRDQGGMVLAMQLRIALAGIGRITGPLTPSRFEQLGGVAGLGAQYVESATRNIPDSWPVLNSMAERTSDGRAKAVPLTRPQILQLVPPGHDVDPLLQTLVDARILRRRLPPREH
jgi:energy-coupling factor transporter ATP-binding protein EcfA2